MKTKNDHNPFYHDSFLEFSEFLNEGSGILTILIFTAFVVT